jgi:hypothetical protein
MPIGHAPYGTFPLGGAVPVETRNLILINPAAQYLHYYTPLTQKAANYLPQYQYGRQYKYSVYQQILNAIMIHFDQLRLALNRQEYNRFPQTFLRDTIDVIYTQPKLAESTFVTGLKNDNWSVLKKIDLDNPEQWWYEDVPTELLEYERKFDSVALLNNVPLSTEILINQRLINPSGLYIILRSENGNFINNIKGEDILGTDIIIYGEDEYGINRNEKFTFYYPSYQRSKTNWKKIFRVECSYFDSSNAFSLFIGNYIPSDYTIREDFLYTLHTPDREIKSVFWDISEDRKKLQLKTLVADNILTYHAGIKDFNIVKEFVIVDIDGAPVEDLQSILPSDFDDKLYVINKDKIFILSKLDEYPNVVAKATEIRTPDPALNLDVRVETGYVIIRGIKSVANTGKDITGAILYVENSQGRFYYDNGSWSTNNPGFTDIPLEQEISFGNGTPFGEHFYIALLTNTNAGIDTDTFIVEGQVKKPLFITNTSSFIPGSHMIYKYDDSFAFANDEGHVDLSFVFDSYIVDSKRNLMIFREKYFHIQYINTDGTVAASGGEPVPQNVFNELDQYGALLGLERRPGEKSYQFLKRIKDVFYYPSSSTYKGLVYSLSRDLILPVSEVIDLTLSDDIIINIKYPYITVKSGALQSQFNLFNNSGNNGTISDVIEWLNTITGVHAESVNDTYVNSLPARALIESTNFERIYNYIAGQSTSISPNIGDAKIVESSISIDGFEKVQYADLASLKTPAYSFIPPNNILLNRPLINDGIHFDIIKNKFSLYASPVIIYMPHNLDNDFIDNNKLSALAKDLLTETENIYPYRWRY